jgi:hypothetical protein
MRNRAPKPRGEAMLESALVLFTLVLTILGILDLGQFLFFQATFRERVRSGVRYAIVNAYDPHQITNFVLYGSAAPSGRPLFGLSESMISVARYGQNTADDRIEVTISNPPLKMYSPFLARLSAQPVFRAVMPVESLGAAN